MSTSESKSILELVLEGARLTALGAVGMLVVGLIVRSAQLIYPGTFLLVVGAVTYLVLYIVTRSRNAG